MREDQVVTPRCLGCLGSQGFVIACAIRRDRRAVGNVTIFFFLVLEVAIDLPRLSQASLSREYGGTQCHR